MFLSNTQVSFTGFVWCETERENSSKVTYFTNKLEQECRLHPVSPSEEDLERGGGAVLRCVQ